MGNLVSQKCGHPVIYGGYEFWLHTLRDDKVRAAKGYDKKVRSKLAALKISVIAHFFLCILQNCLQYHHS